MIPAQSRFRTPMRDGSATPSADIKKGGKILIIFNFKSMKKLILNKETINQLDSGEFQQLKAGADAWGKCNATYRCDQFTGGCSDCCGGLATVWNCTDGHCTQDCTGGYTIATEKEVTSGRLQDVH